MMLPTASFSQTAIIRSLTHNSGIGMPQLYAKLQTFLWKSQWVLYQSENLALKYWLMWVNLQVTVIWYPWPGSKVSQKTTVKYYNGDDSLMTAITRM